MAGEETNSFLSRAAEWRADGNAQEFARVLPEIERIRTNDLLAYYRFMKEGMSCFAAAAATNNDMAASALFACFTNLMRTNYPEDWKEASECLSLQCGAIESAFDYPPAQFSLPYLSAYAKFLGAIRSLKITNYVFHGAGLPPAARDILMGSNASEYKFLNAQDKAKFDKAMAEDAKGREMDMFQKRLENAENGIKFRLLFNCSYLSITNLTNAEFFKKAAVDAHLTDKERYQLGKKE
jgi:hypothetical protein